jgi:meso-butanediol dehydrogenase/(S,S)-butanediol dehydrogenase/diacetyl reductase
MRLVDVTDRMQVRALIAHAVSVFGKIDVKFNNAGVNKPMNFST